MRQKQTPIKVIPDSLKQIFTARPLVETDSKKKRTISDAEFKELESQYTGLILSLVRKYYNWGAQEGLTNEDLKQAGRMGLQKAAETYDPEKGIPFILWAKKRIEWEMMNRIKQNALVKPTAGRKNAVVVGMDVFAPSKSDAGDVDARLKLSELAVSKDGSSLEEEFENVEALEKMRKIIDKLKLKPRDRQILQLRMNGKGFEEIAKALEPRISRERVRQILIEIEEKAREWLERKTEAPKPIDRIPQTAPVQWINAIYSMRDVRPSVPVVLTNPIDLSKSIYFTLKGAELGKEPEKILELLMSKNVVEAAGKIKDAIMKKYPNATNNEIAHAISMEINRFGLESVKGEMHWKWTHTRNKKMIVVGMAKDIDPPSILREKAEMILAQE